MARRACATVLLCGYKAMTHNFDYVIHIAVRGGKRKLNKRTRRNAEPRPSVNYQIFDTDVMGFAAQVAASGARTFTIDYRHAGRQRRMTIGRWPEWSVTAARERAKEMRRASTKVRIRCRPRKT